MRWLADENIPKLLVLWLIERGDDVLDVAASEEHCSWPDERLWQLAGRERRIVVTRDRTFLRPGLEPSPPGVVVVRTPSSWHAAAIARLASNTISQLTADALLGNLTIVSPEGSRQRPLSHLPRQFAR